jgi:hypothetical protein
MAEKDLPSLLRSLRETTPKLNKATDDASRVIREVENFLAELRLGIPAYVVVETSFEVIQRGEDREDVQHYTCLHFRKHGNDFRLVIEKSDLFQDSDGVSGREVILSTTPLSEAGRHDKLRGVAVIPALLAHIVAEAKRVQEAAAKAGGTVSDLLVALAAEHPARSNPWPPPVRNGE